DWEDSWRCLLRAGDHRSTTQCASIRMGGSTRRMPADASIIGDRANSARFAMTPLLPRVIEHDNDHERAGINEHGTDCGQDESGETGGPEVARRPANEKRRH